MKPASDRTRRTRAWGIAVILAIVAVQIATHLIDTGVYGLRIGALDSGLDSSIFGVAGGIIVVMAAVAGIAAGVMSRRRWPAICGVVLAAYAVLSLLEVPQTRDGVLIVLPLLLIMLIALWRSAEDEPAPIARLLRIGAGLLVLSFALHVALPFVFRHAGIASGSWPYEVKVALKMASEIAGFGLVAVAFAAIVSEHTARGAPRIATA